MQSKNYFMKNNIIGFSTWTASDMELAKTLWGNPDVTKYIARNGVYSQQEIEERMKLEINNQSQFGVQCWPIFDLETGDFVGTSGLRPHCFSINSFEISCNILPEHQNGLYGINSLKAVISYAVNVLQAKHMFGGHHIENGRSKRVIRHLGFKYHNAEYREAFDSYHPSYILSVGANDPKYFSTYMPQLIGQLKAA